MGYERTPSHLTRKDLIQHRGQPIEADFSDGTGQIQLPFRREALPQRGFLRNR